MKFLVTADNNGAIGRGEQPLVTIPAVQQGFLKETQGKVVVMGRKTLEGLPGGQPLGKRINVVLSENPSYKIKGAVVCHSIAETMEYLKQFSEDDIYVIGGEEIYREFLPYCDVAHVTKIDHEYLADAFFPDLDREQDWVVTADSEEQTYFDLEYTFLRYERRPKN